MQSYWEFFDKLEKESIPILQSGEYSNKELRDQLLQTEDDPVLMEKYRELLEQKKSECMEKHGLYAFMMLLMYECILIMKSDKTTRNEKVFATTILHKYFTYCYYSVDFVSYTVGVEPAKNEIGFAFEEVEAVVEKLYHCYYDYKDPNTKVLLLLCYQEHGFIDSMQFGEFMKSQFPMPNVPDYPELTRRMVDSIQVIRNQEIEKSVRLKTALWLRDVLNHCLLDKELDQLTFIYKTTLGLNEKRTKQNLLRFDVDAIWNFVRLMSLHYDKKEDDN